LVIALLGSLENQRRVGSGVLRLKRLHPLKVSGISHNGSEFFQLLKLAQGWGAIHRRIYGVNIVNII
jgi:hypothetical protein